MGGKSIDWSTDSGCTVPLKLLEDKPRKGSDFAELPGYAMNKDNYKPVEEEFEEWIYRNERVKLMYSPLYKMYSTLGESEGDFRARLAVKGREARDEAVDKMRDRYASMAKNLMGRAGRLIAEESIQMHGGIAMTQEYELAHIAKRIVMAEHRFGDADTQLERFLDLSAA